MRDQIGYNKSNWKDKKGILCIIFIVLFVIVVASIILIVKVQQFKGR